MQVYQALERALGLAVRDEAELLAARDEWNELAGKVSEEEPLYEERAAAFLDWFLLERRGPTTKPPSAEPTTPIERIAASAAEDDPLRPAFHALTATHRSLFRVRGQRPGELLLDDLWGGGGFRVHERRQLPGLGRGSLLDARVVAHVESPPDLLLVRIACVHPAEVDAAIARHLDDAKRKGQPREALLFLLLRLRLRCERYHHLPPVKVYADGERA